MSRTQTHTFWLTSAVDFQDHAVIDVDFEDGLIAGHGTYPALCGKSCLPAP